MFCKFSCSVHAFISKPLLNTPRERSASDWKTEYFIKLHEVENLLQMYSVIGRFGASVRSLFPFTLNVPEATEEAWACGSETAHKSELALSSKGDFED